MIQTLKVNTVIEIPATHVLIEKEEYDKLQALSVIGQTGDSAWFEQQVPYSFSVAKERILYPFRDELERFIKYPKTREHWKFQKTKTLEWLENNWEKWN